MPELPSLVSNIGVCKVNSNSALLEDEKLETLSEFKCTKMIFSYFLLYSSQMGTICSNYKFLNYEIFKPHYIPIQVNLLYFIHKVNLYNVSYNLFPCKNLNISLSQVATELEFKSSTIQDKTFRVCITAPIQPQNYCAI